MRQLVPGILLLLFFGCKQAIDAPPANAVGPTVLSQVLTDIHLARAETEIARDIDSVAVHPSDSIICAKHGITVEQYRLTMTWYQQHPRELSVIYEEVLNELSRRQGSASLPSAH